jgi:hypothetical protein
MVAIVSVETLLLVVLVVLVAGLLRSHAEILRRLGPASDEAPPIQPPPSRAPVDGEIPAPALSGSSPAGDLVTLAFDGASSTPTLLAFLTSGCSTCARFWSTLAEPRLPPEVQTVIVTRGPDRESPTKLSALSPPGIPVVMSSQAWADYGTPGAPYFVLVDRVVLGEGVATTWQALASLVSDAIADDAAAHPGGPGAPAPGGAVRRARDIDERLAAAGIGPGHPSLYPGGPSSAR